MTTEESREARYKDALMDMVWQFAYRYGAIGDDRPEHEQPLTTGGLSALEHAFDVLGIPERCEVADWLRVLGPEEATDD